MARQFVYFMKGLSKAYPTRKVLDNVHLSFYPDAKIGVLGVNGSGKSTLLRIMAGIDKDYNGEAWVAEGARLWDLDSKVDQAMYALRCPPDDADVTKLSGGERRRVALCKLLLDQPE